MPGAALRTYSYSHLEKSLGACKWPLPRSKQQVSEGGVRGKSVMKGKGGGRSRGGGSTEKRLDVACDQKHVTKSWKRGADWVQLVVNVRRVLGRVAEAPWHGPWRHVEGKVAQSTVHDGIVARYDAKFPSAENRPCRPGFRWYYQNATFVIFASVEVEDGLLRSHLLHRSGARQSALRLCKL